MKSRISIKGQVTIPKKVRSALGLHPGTQVDFVVEGGRLVGVKRLVEDPFHRWRGRGAVPGFTRVDSYLEALRDAHGAR